MSGEIEDVPPDDPIQSEDSQDNLNLPQEQQLTEAHLIDDKHDTKNESLDDTTEDDQMSTRRSRDASRELKQLLALSKEAKLETNISYKRKSMETSKIKEYASILMPEGGMVVKKYKADKFPVTADSELDMDTVAPLEVSISEKVEVKSKEVGGEERKIMKDMRDCKPFKPNKDIFCWRCHREGVTLCCETCPRSYHHKCLKQTIVDTEHWPCPECVTILKAENTQTRSPAMKGMTLEHLCSLLKFAVKRMMECNGSEPFFHPVNDKDFPEYKKYIIQPMTLTSLEKNIKENLYGSTQAFEADAKWILHNSIIFNSYQSKLTSFAKTILKICKQEMAEIENCPSCYLNANTKKTTWFVEVCPKPHILVWAKLKGFPYWPAKAMCTNSTGMVDVRFFGAHDRAWVPSKECFLYSRKDPNSNKQKRNDIIECMREVEVYISNIKALYGEFNYAPFKLPYDPENELKQLLLFIPRYKPNAPPPRRRSRPPESKEKQAKTDEKSDENEKTLDESVDYETGDQGDDCESITTNESFRLANDEISTNKEDTSGVDLEESLNNVDEENSSIGPETNEDNEPLSSMIKNKLVRVNIKTRGGVLNTYGKSRTIARSSSENSSRKVSIDDKIKTNDEETSNADVSITSSSSEILNSGEISSSTNDVESKKSEHSDSSSSSPNKVRIIDTLMKKLSSSEEDISEAKVSEEPIKSQTDILLENYKNSVEEKNESAEISNIIDGDTDVLKDEKMDIDENNDVKSENKVNIETNSSSENFKSVSSSEDGDRSGKLEIVESSSMDNSIVVSPEKTTSNQDKCNISPKLPKVDDSNSIVKNGQEKISSDVLNDDSKRKLILPKEENINTRKSIDSDKEDKTGISLKSKEKLPSKHDVKIVGDTKKENKKKDRIIVKLSSKRSRERSRMPETKSSDTKDELRPPKPKRVVVISDETSTKLEKIDFSSQKQPNSKSFRITFKESPEEDLISSSQKTEEKPDEIKPGIPKDKSESEFNEGVDSNSSDDVDVPLELDYSQMNENNIRNIIHSSLNDEKDTSKRRIEDVNEKSDSDDSTNAPVSKKAKHVNSGVKKTPDDSTFKIVPIQSILNKKIDSTEQSNSPETQILRKKLSQPSGSSGSNERRDSLGIQMETVEIKSEPDSGDDDLVQAAYMEKKRKYFSALNISERGAKKDESKRSKTEDSGDNSKYMDNLTKVIEDVATNFSAKHEAPKRTVTRKSLVQSTSHQMNVKKLATLQENGEIYVKSFAKLPQQVRTSSQRSVHKPKTVGTFTIKQVPSPNRREPLKISTEITPTTTLQRLSSTPSTMVTQTQNAVSTSSSKMESISSPGNVLILTQPGVILPTSQQLALNTGGFVTFVPSQQNMAMVQTPQVINAMMATGLQQNDQSRTTTSEVHSSQNYIPQNDIDSRQTDKTVLPERGSAANVETNRSNEIPSLIPINSTQTSNRNNETNSNGVAESSGPNATDEEFSLLNSLLPENVSRAISEVLCRPPPKLKPRPPGPLSQHFDSGNPSTAGPVSARINSVAHRLSDYMRGMLIETLEDLGKVTNPEATIASLRLELETLQNKHSVELMDLRKNMCTILKDIQTSVVEEKERIINETRSACEVETLKRIEEAKSKQWCASCGKEAQFYCCWNTSYCDYPCQQKHWSKHMNKCTQHAGQTQAAPTPPMRPQSQITFRPATPKTFAGRVVTKPTKVYLNRGSTQKNVSTFKAPAGSHVTLLDASNLEFLTNTSIGAKFIATSSLFTKVKTVNSTVTSPSNSSQQTIVSKRMQNVIQHTQSSDKNMSSLISDDEAESE